jgi:hypothetical protein
VVRLWITSGVVFRKILVPYLCVPSRFFAALRERTITLYPAHSRDITARVVFTMICRLAAQRELFIRNQANAGSVGLCRSLTRAEEATRSNQITAKNFENSSILFSLANHHPSHP